MDASLYSLVTESFSDVMGRFNVRLCESTSEEVVLVGSGYAILIWIDRDGVSLQYLDLVSQANQGTVDLGAYLATKRRWVVDQQAPRSEDYWSMIQRGLHNSSLTLSEMAPDILSGEKTWLTESSIVYNPLSESHRERLSHVITRC